MAKGKLDVCSREKERTRLAEDGLVTLPYVRSLITSRGGRAWDAGIPRRKGGPYGGTERREAYRSLPVKVARGMPLCCRATSLPGS